MNKIQSENITVYNVATTSENDTIAAALSILASRLNVAGVALENPKDTQDYLTLKLAGKPAECFSVLFLDNRHRVIDYRELWPHRPDCRYRIFSQTFGP